MHGKTASQSVKYKCCNILCCWWLAQGCSFTFWESRTLSSRYFFFKNTSTAITHIGKIPSSCVIHLQIFVFSQTGIVWTFLHLNQFNLYLCHPFNRKTSWICQVSGGLLHTSFHVRTFIIQKKTPKANIARNQKPLFAGYVVIGKMRCLPMI